MFKPAANAFRLVAVTSEYSSGTSGAGTTGSGTTDTLSGNSTFFGCSSIPHAANSDMTVATLADRINNFFILLFPFS